MIHKVIQRVIDASFTLTSVIFHTALFIFWFKHRFDINLLTNVVSLEAIYLALFIGYTQKKHKKHTDKHLEHITEHLGKHEGSDAGKR